jgi:hypothetical protein
VSSLFYKERKKKEGRKERDKRKECNDGKKVEGRLKI